MNYNKELSTNNYKEKEKPVVRWVIGPCNQVGFDILNFSIKKFVSLYANKFRYIICYNNLSHQQINNLPIKLVDDIIDQEKFSKSLELPIPNLNAGSAWKLYPPRLYPECHEILLDNDLVIYRKIKEIDEFLSCKDHCIVTEAYRRSYAGKFEKLIRDGFSINSGLVGLPPHFDYQEKIQNIIKSLKIKNWTWDTHFEEQSVVAAVLQNENTRIIPLAIIAVNGEEIGDNIGFNGTHFIGANKGFSKHWRKFKTTILMN